MLEQLQRTFGTTFRFERELGGGGMSRVFIAEERELGRRVVVKVLPPELAAGLNVDRFKREIQLAASLQHPHIVPVHTTGEVNGMLYFTMPFIEGESLRSRIARGGELPIGDVCRILADVLDALAYAHSHGVVHRDIKPDNVLISGRHSLVTDFGVAKALSRATGESKSHLTSAGVALGTPAYMAPEQAAGDPNTDHRADIYAVGVLAYEMLTGRPPFVAPTPQMVLAAHVTQSPEPLTKHRASVPAGIAGLVMRCLEKKPADRWQSADEIRQQLESMTTPSGGLSPTASRGVESSRWSRWKIPALAIAAAMLLIAAGAGASRFLNRNATSEARAAATSGIGLVVLPFENMGSSEDAYFADGITEEITSRLARLQGLAVIARTSALQYKNTSKSVTEIGQELDVDYVLEGTVRWEKSPNGPSRVRVSPQLIRVNGGTNVWAEPYEAELERVFQLQAAIAERVAEALSVRLLASDAGRAETRPTTSTEAYDFYLRGNAATTRGESEADLREAIDMYDRAVRADSHFALAHARLARAHAMMYWLYFDRSDTRLATAKKFADRALALNPELPDAQLAQRFMSNMGQRAADPVLDRSPNRRRPGIPEGPAGLRP